MGDEGTSRGGAPDRTRLADGADDRLHRLEALIGEWKTTITMLDADGAEGAVSSASDIYWWSPNGKFVEHRVDAEMDGARIQSLEVIALDPSGQGYATRSYEPDGSVVDFGAERDGRSWRITGEVLRFAGEFSEDGDMLSGRWEQKSAGNWAPLMKVELRKQA